MPIRGPYDLTPADPPTSETTVDLVTALLAHLRAAEGPDGETILTVLGAAPGRLYYGAPPEDVVFPYLLLRLDRESAQGYTTYRDTFTIEVQVIGRPEGQRSAVEWVADLVDRALLSLAERWNGMMVVTGRARSSLPAFTVPADEHVVGVRAVYTGYLWPRMLTNRASG